MISIIKRKIKKIITNYMFRNYYKMCPGFTGGGWGIHIDNKCTFEDYVCVAHHAQIQDSHIGNHSSVGRYDKIREADIGRYCSISWDVTIGAPTHPFTTITNSALTYRKEYGVVDFDANLPQKRTKIGHDVWIGCDVTLIAGVSVGDGAVIGAGAVVTKDIPPYEIWAGVPAKRIGARFSDEIIAVLEEIQWWDWSSDEIKDCLELFKKDLDYKTVVELKDKHTQYRNNATFEESNK